MIHSKSLEKAKIEVLDGNYTDFDKKMKIPTYIKEDISWKKNLKNSRKQIKMMNFKKDIFSVASMTGWGAFCNGKEANGRWDLEESRLHINYLELKSVLLAIKCLASDISECEG